MLFEVWICLVLALSLFTGSTACIASCRHRTNPSQASSKFASHQTTMTLMEYRSVVRELSASFAHRFPPPLINNPLSKPYPNLKPIHTYCNLQNQSCSTKPLKPYNQVFGSLCASDAHSFPPRPIDPLLYRQTQTLTQNLNPSNLNTVVKTTPPQTYNPNTSTTLTSNTLPKLRFPTSLPCALLLRCPACS